jgi:hypothetical protein
LQSSGALSMMLCIVMLEAFITSCHYKLWTVSRTSLASKNWTELNMWIVISSFGKVVSPPRCQLFLNSGYRFAVSCQVSFILIPRLLCCQDGRWTRCPSLYQPNGSVSKLRCNFRSCVSPSSQRQQVWDYIINNS